ncbi:hydrolase or metal-binding protein [uncultured Propionivibrio sp.]|uniref:recombination directionality factor n=1 Tax=uncultured Propionivibrio sp. TaxID=426737 RepID=UPI0029BFAC24|nr:hydrolase or metal-binding protein [uncultured Propionivibrio sp.]
MIKGLAITPPVIGRISIGKVVERNGKRLPEKDDCFTLTTQVQTKDGWLLHPLHQKLLEASATEKLRAIPVTLLFNASDLNLRAEYSLFDKTTGRPLCVGNGETAKGVTSEGMKEYACPSPGGCEMGKKGGCKPYGRLNVQVEGQEDELGCFIFRTTGFNSIRTLTARLEFFEAVSGGATRYLPLQLKLRGKSTTQSHRAPVYYVDLCLRDGMTLKEAVVQAGITAAQHNDSGVDIRALEAAARSALANGAFEDSEDETPDIVEEFFSAIGHDSVDDGSPTSTTTGLAAKLAEKAEHTSTNIPNN